MQTLPLPQICWAKRVGAQFLVLAMLIAISLATTPPVQAQAMGAFNFNDAIIVQHATAGNSVGDSTVIMNAATDGHPNAILLISQLWMLDGSCGCVYNNHPVGVWYNTITGHWEIFNEDGSLMPVGVFFSVSVWSAPVSQLGIQIYSHVASAQPQAPYTDLNNSISNSNPNAMVLVTPIWNPPASGKGVVDNHAVGVWYNAATGHWSIFNEDEATMPGYAGFNVMVWNASYGWASNGYVLKSTAANTKYDYTNLTDPFSTTDVDLWVTPNWNPGGCVTGCQVFHNHPLGTWYNTSVGHLSVFNEDGSMMPLGVSFNVLEMGF
jgi:hypothetical protein